MNREIIRAIKTCDIGEYFRLVDEYPHAVLLHRFEIYGISI